MKPALNAEIARHFGDAQTHRRLIQPKAFQPERQFMPHLIRNDLMIRILHHVGDSAALRAQIQRFDRLILKQDRARLFAVRRENRLQMPKQRGFAAAGFADDRQKFAALHAQAYILQYRLIGAGRITEIQILDIEMCHAIFSQ